MPNHKIIMSDEDGRPFATLEDIFPPESPKILIVGKVPSPFSVEVGHYFQGSMGHGFWNRLREYELFEANTEIWNDIGEDDFLVQHGYGITDVVKKPRQFGNQPTAVEYRYGAKKLIGQIELLRPHVVLFVFKRAFDKILDLHFRIYEQSQYGFNNQFSHLFSDCRLFVFPMNGTPATRAEIACAMLELQEVINALQPE
ncbi:MAG: uracil-DNA glycosylase family protein [Clostridiaceae bacterium]|nr:uracil-DNA glycosylase family protein [Clostridiaceae bacterium]